MDNGTINKIDGRPAGREMAGAGPPFFFSLAFSLLLLTLPSVVHSSGREGQGEGHDGAGQSRAVFAGGWMSYRYTSRESSLVVRPPAIPTQKTLQYARRPDNLGVESRTDMDGLMMASNSPSTRRAV